MKKLIAGASGILVICLLALYVSFIYRDQVRIYPKKEAPVITLGNAIEDREFLTVLDGFSEPLSQVSWIDEDAVTLKTDAGKNLEYRLTTQELTPVNDEVIPEFPLTIVGGGSLDYNQEGILTYQKDNKVTPIDKGLTQGAEEKWVLSPDQKKVIFVDAETGLLKVFLFSKRKIYVTGEPVQELARTHLRQAISFSPNAGYFFLVSTLDDPKGATFSVYGADSAKLYAKDMMGFEPVWAPDKILKIAYRYTEDLEEIESQSDSILRFLPERIGFFDIRTKRATYMTLPEGGKLYGPMIWHDNELMATLIDKEKNATGLYRYNVKDKKAYLKAFETPVPLTEISQILTQAKDNKICYTYQTVKSTFAVVLQGAEWKNLVDLKLLRVDGQATGVAFSPYGLIYAKENKLYIQRIDAVRVILNADEADIALYASPLGGRLFIVVEEGGQRQILWVALDKL